MHDCVVLYKHYVTVVFKLKLAHASKCEFDKVKKHVIKQVYLKFKSDGVSPV